MNDENPKRQADDERTGPEILFVEPDAGLRKSISLTFKEKGLPIHTANNEGRIRRILEHKPPDIFVFDFKSFMKTSGEWIRIFRKQDDGGKRLVVVMTTQRLEDAWRKKYKPDVVLYKPIDVRFLYRRIQQLI